jgi:hypothetical protein
MSRRTAGKLTPEQAARLLAFALGNDRSSSKKRRPKGRQSSALFASAPNWEMRALQTRTRLNLPARIQKPLNVVYRPADVTKYSDAITPVKAFLLASRQPGRAVSDDAFDMIEAQCRKWHAEDDAEYADHHRTSGMD